MKSLYHNTDFLRLWTSQTISLFGSEITYLALPLAAVLLLQATPLQVGLLAAAEYLPFVLLGLVAGVWVDRIRRRPVLIAMDIGRGLLLGLIPVAAVMGLLRIELLVAIAFAAGCLSVFFDLAYQSFLPTLVDREQLLEGNSKLEIGRSLAEIAAPGLGGAIVQLLTAPFAIALDALSFFVSAALVAATRTPEPPPARSHRDLRQEIGDGVRLVVQNPTLRSLISASAAVNVCQHVVLAVYVLYVSRELGLTPLLLGTVLSVGSVGGLCGAMIAPRVPRVLGLGRTFVAAVLLVAFGQALIPLAGLVPWCAIPLLIAAQFASYVAMLVFNINCVTLRQTITPPHMLGRVSATSRMVAWGGSALGSIAGGVLGNVIGLDATLIAAVAALALVALRLLLSPLRAVAVEPGAQLQVATA
jgi:MFS family permease